MSSSTDLSGVAPSSQNEWHRYIPRSPSPSNPSRSRMRSAAADGVVAHAVELGLLAELLALPKYVRTLPFGRRSA